MNHDIIFLLPDILLVSCSIYVFFVVLYYHGSHDARTKSLYVSLLCLVIIFLLGVIWLQLMVPRFSSYYVRTLFFSTELIIFVRLLIHTVSIVCIIFVFCFNKNFLSTPLLEFFLLIFLLILGMVLSVSSTDLIIIFLSIELQSLVLYIFIASFKNSNLAIEASLKYYIMGSFASLFILFGISLLYRLYGFTCLDSYTLFFNEHVEVTFLAKLGFTLICCGLLLKLGMAPFHYWVADIYQGSSLPITAIFAILVKLPIFVVFLKCYFVFLFPFPRLAAIITLFSMCSICIGIFLSMYETNLKRFLAFSTISHIGFIVLGSVYATPDAYAFSIYYMIIYIINNIILFGILLFFVEYQFGKSPVFLLNRLHDLVYVGRSNVPIACMLGAVFLSMAGIPPFTGFFAKFFVSYAIFNSGDYFMCFLFLSTSVISCVYYIRCIRFLFLDTDYNINLNISFKNSFILSFVVVFFFP